MTKIRIDTTPDDLMRLIEHYAANVAAAELHDSADAHKARDRALRKSDDLRARIRAEVQQLSATRRPTTAEEATA